MIFPWTSGPVSGTIMANFLLKSNRNKAREPLKMALKIYNTMSRTIEEFKPLDAPLVRVYTCGPTVYDYAHIGNFRAYIFEDLLRRYLKYSGFDVLQVMNLTDVDDKTIRNSRAAGKSLLEWTNKFKDAFFEDLEILNIERAEHYPAATDHVPEMIKLISVLLEKGVAYRSPDGSVYFNITRFKDYGKLARLDMAGLKPGARVDQDEYIKENLGDFALWKAWSEDDGDVVWDAPWGRGRPGWHIECSAMSMKYLGETLDIHTGGIDNMFPHHEDEIAQSESATGRQFARYWMHCAHLIVDGEKMSKSLGNFYTLRDLLDKGFSGREVRYVLISAHYRQSLNFTFDSLRSARSALSRIDEFLQRFSKISEGSEPGRPPEWVDECRKRFKEAMDDDLNISEAFAALFGMLHAGNKAADSGDINAGEAAATLAAFQDFDRVLGLAAFSEDKPDEAVMELVRQRQEAREAKDWKRADEARASILEKGWMVKDTPAGPELKKI